MLNDVFKRQLALNRKYEYWGGNKEQMTKEYVLAILDELSEVLMQINWKIWKKSKIKIDELELKYELIDILIFTITLMQVWGMDAKEAYQLYLNKTGENHERIKRRY